MDIFKWEIRKIWRRTSTKVVIVMAVAYVVFSTIYNSVYNLGSTRSEGFGKNPDGISQIAEQYKYADGFGGELTEESLIKVYDRIQAAYAPENIVEFPDGSRGITNDVWNEYIVPIKGQANLMMSLCRFDTEYNSIYKYDDIPRSFAENFYEIRNKSAEQFISTQVLDEKDRQFFLAQNAKIETPFKYDWFEGQRIYLEIMSPIPLIIALIIAVFISPVYALEYQQKTDSVVLSARRGRGRLAFAKLAAAAVFSSVVYLLCMGIYVAVQLIFCGTRALDCPIQLIKPIAAVPMTIFQAELYLIALGFLSCIAITAVTLLLSSVMNIVFPAAASAMLVIIVPMLMSGAVPESLSFITAIIPFMSDYTELFRTNIYFHIWSPYLMIAAPILIFIICAPIAAWKFSKHQTVK